MSGIPIGLVLFLMFFFSFLIAVFVLITQNHQKKLFSAPSKLGDSLGLKKLLTRQGRKQNDWYGGELNGHPFVFTYGSSKDHTSQQGHSPILRLLIGIQRSPSEPEFNLFHGAGSKLIKRSEKTFPNGAKGSDVLTLEEKKSLKSVAENVINLRLKTRSKFNPTILPPTLLPSSSLVLAHHWKGIEHSASQVKERLVILTQLAEVLNHPSS